MIDKRKKAQNTGNLSQPYKSQGTQPDPVHTKDWWDKDVRKCEDVHYCVNAKPIEDYVCAGDESPQSKQKQLHNHNHLHYLYWLLSNGKTLSCIVGVVRTIYSQNDVYDVANEID